MVKSNPLSVNRLLMKIPVDFSLKISKLLNQPVMITIVITENANQLQPLKQWDGKGAAEITGMPYGGYASGLDLIDELPDMIHMIVGIGDDGYFHV